MSLYYCARCGKDCDVFGHIDKSGALTCYAKQPEPKKEKPMATLEINTQLFDGLNLSQRIQMIVELDVTEQNQKAFGTTTSKFLAEVIGTVQRNLIDSTVEKFGGGE